MTPEDIQKRLLYRDALMLVLDKPAGIPVHKGSGGGETLDSYFEHLRFGLPNPPALAHRLDKDTSGCLVLGRHRQALERLGKLFAGNQVQKTYWAVVEGVPPEQEGVIDAPLGKQSKHRHQWWMKVDPSGAPAQTDYKVLHTKEGMSWLELKPHTGRTHQLRVHCAHIGCPIVGDKIYGTRAHADKLMLHAQQIILPLYPKKDPISVTAPMPDAMTEYLKQYAMP